MGLILQNLVLFQQQCQTPWVTFHQYYQMELSAFHLPSYIHIPYLCLHTYIDTYIVMYTCTYAYACLLIHTQPPILSTHPYMQIGIHLNLTVSQLCCYPLVFNCITLEFDVPRPCLFLCQLVQYN